MEYKIVEDIMVECPLLNNKIPEGLCYDIHSVAFNMYTPELIDNITTIEEAKLQYRNCENLMHTPTK